MLSVAGEENFIKTVDYVSNQGPTWILTAALLICGGVVVYLMRRILKEAQDGRVELKGLNEKHIAVLEKSAVAVAENASELRFFGRQVAIALENSTSVIKSNTEAIHDNTDATKLQVKASDASTRALMDLRGVAEGTANEVRRQGQDAESVIRRNTDALERQEHER